MTDADKIMLKDTSDAIDSCLEFAYLSVGIEFQEEAIAKLKDLEKRIDSRLKEMIAARSESEANLAWIANCYISGMIEFMTMWTHLKKDDMEAAWFALVAAQEQFETALRLRPNAGFSHINHNIYALEQLLFPPTYFISSSIIVERFDCNICGTEYGECDHIAMNLYMGKMCCKVVRGIRGIDHVAFVKHPEDKRLRSPRFGGENGFCSLTYRPRARYEPQGEESIPLSEQFSTPCLE